MKTFMGKVITIILIMTMSVALFVGCKGDQATSDKVDITKGNESNTKLKDTKEKVDKNEEDIELHYVQTVFTDESQREIFEGIINNYVESTGVKVRVEYIPDDQYTTWVATQFAAGTPPDIVNDILYTSTDNYNKGFFQDISGFLEKESEYNPGQPWKETFSKTLIDRVYLEGDKGVPGVPTTTVSVRIFYNKDLFDKAGISSVPTTWAEFIDVCNQLKTADILPFAFPNSMHSDVSWLWFNNSVSNQLSFNSVFKELDIDGSAFVEIDEIARGVDEGIIDFSKPCYADTFNLIKDFSNYWTSDYNSLDQKSAMEMFLRGEVAMGQFGSWQLKVIDGAEGRDFEYGVMPVPVVTEESANDVLGRSVVLGGQPDGILNISRHVEGAKLDAAIQFLQYMSSPEVQKQNLEELYRLSSLVHAGLPDKLKGFIITEEPLRLPYFTGVNTQARVFFHRAGQLFLSGDMSVEEFGEVLTKEYKDIVDTIKAENGWTKENNYGNDE